MADAPRVGLPPPPPPKSSVGLPPPPPPKKGPPPPKKGPPPSKPPPSKKGKGKASKATKAPPKKGQSTKLEGELTLDEISADPAREPPQLKQQNSVGHVTRLKRELADAGLSRLADPIVEDLGIESLEALRSYTFEDLQQDLKDEASVDLKKGQIRQLKAFLSTGTGADEHFARAQAQNALQDLQADELNLLIDRALGSGGVPWPHARVMIRGEARQGKTSTINAMAGRAFDAQSQSTVGAASEELELHRSELAVGGDGELRPYEGVSGGEYASALAAQAASLAESQEAEEEAEQEAELKAEESQIGGKGAVLSLPWKGDRPDGGDELRAARDLVIRQAKGEHSAPELVLKMVDTGGQSVFLSVLELLTTPSGTVYVTVFSLVQLQDHFEESIASTVSQLHSIQLFAAGAPVILAGTHRDGVRGGKSALETLSNDLLARLEQLAAPAIKGLLKPTGSPNHCFFAIENSKGIEGDATIRQLVGAIERAARALPSLQQNVPLPWLLVHDELRALQSGGRFVDTDDMGMDNVGVDNVGMYAVEEQEQTVEDNSPVQSARTQSPVRTLSFTEVCEIARRHGLGPSGRDGMFSATTLEHEVSAMLSFFHSLSVVLWWDTPLLRDLVILDPRWVLDAVTSFVRDFSLIDHTKRNVRMRLLDERARAEQPENWSMLTDGRATLKRELLNVLWDHADFIDHKPELIELLTRFGLAIPLPKKPDELLVPALLQDATQSYAATMDSPIVHHPPPNWPAAKPDAACLRIFFHLEGQLPPGRLVYSAADLAAGFLPTNAFHRLCASALGSSHAPPGVELGLSRSHAYVAFDKEMLTLEHVASESSIVATLSTDGRDGAAGRVADRLRCILAEDVAASYHNLSYHLLVPHPTRSTCWVDLDAMQSGQQFEDEERAAPGVNQAPVDDHDGLNVELKAPKLTKQVVSSRNLQADLMKWLTNRCTFYFIDAAKLRDEAAALPRMVRLQDMLSKHPDWVVKHEMTLRDACLGAYARSYLAVSHRWESPKDADPSGRQLEVIRAHLRENSKIKFVWVDVMCLFQGDDRTAAEKDEFKLMLPNINLLYLGTCVLILQDASYTTRFWTLFEAWLAFAMATESGLVVATPSRRRATIVCLEGDCEPGVLSSFWADCSASVALDKLSRPSVYVTNGSDKIVQLPKIASLDASVRDVVLSEPEPAVLW